MTDPVEREYCSLVWATHVFEGFHHWPGAPEHRSYLRDPHRHLFHARVEVLVGDGDREVEFHDLRDAITEWVDSQERNFGPASCEHIAQRLIMHLSDQYDVQSVTVSEDGENGATLERTK